MADEHDDGKRTPEDWARELFPTGDRGFQHRDAYKHGAASALHQWDAFAYHTGQPLRLSREDYEAALKAATTLEQVERTREDGETETVPDYKPHAAAVGQYKAAEALRADDNNRPAPNGGKNVGDLPAPAPAPAPELEDNVHVSKARLGDLAHDDKEHG